MKKDGIKKQTRASLPETFKCGECLHFAQSKHRSHEDVCKNLGVRTFGIAPSCFTPDYTKVIGNTDEFVQLAALIADKTPQQRKIMMGILRQQPTGKKLKMGTQMFLNYRGRDYVSNYLRGYVVGYTSANEIVLCGSPEPSTRGRSFFAYLKSDQTLLTTKEWKDKMIDLRKRGRIQDPQGHVVRDITAKVKEDNYEVPTIDNAPKEQEGKKAKSNLRRTPLTQILTF